MEKSLSSVTIVDKQLLDGLCLDAENAPRRRKNLNLHTSFDEPVQKFFIAMQVDSYVRPHRHTGKEQTELLIAIRGKFTVLVFTDDGTITERIELSADKGMFGIEIKPNTWHTVLAINTDSVFLEIKQGPYKALSEQDFASWAPQENSPSVASYLQSLKVVDGDI